MFISVVIPAYNEARYIGDCLEALQAQTYPPQQFEIIVADNGSSDDTARLARAYGARVVMELKKGVALARQRGFQEARGPIIASTDADTRVPPWWLERMAGHFSGEQGLGGVCGPVYFADGRPHERLIMRYPVTWAMSLSNHLGHTWWGGSNFAVRAALFWQVGGFSGFDNAGLVGEDIYLAQQLRPVTQLLFDPRLAVYTSARRTGEGYASILRRNVVSLVRVVFLRQNSLPWPDIR
ncbi:MAG: glycosyltransferase family 2 protein [Chloroflexi bacterium]|nr:glycosyltransferase family 2 protein [Chloroflexota bacterium]